MGSKISQTISTPHNEFMSAHIVVLRLQSLNPSYTWRFPKIRDTLLGVPIIRTIVYWGLYLGYLNFGKLRPIHEHDSFEP